MSSAIPSKEKGQEKLGKGCHPGEAPEGELLHYIESLISKKLQDGNPPDEKDALMVMEKYVLGLHVVQEKYAKVDLHYLYQCMIHYKVPDTASARKQTTGSTTSGSAGHSSPHSSPRHSHNSEQYSASGEPISTICLEEDGEAISILLKDPERQEPVYSTNRRNGLTNYMCRNIMERCKLERFLQSGSVVIDLRYTKGGRAFRIENQTFRVKDDLKTDLAFGKELQAEIAKRRSSVSETPYVESTAKDFATISQNDGPKEQAIAARGEKSIYGGSDASVRSEENKQILNFFSQGASVISEMMAKS